MTAPPPPASPPAISAAPLLRVRDLGVTFDTWRGPVQVLHDVSLDLSPGEILGVVGESGAGKSMLGNAIMGLIEPPGRLSAGSVNLYGQRIDTLDDSAMQRIRGKRIGMIFQDPLTSLNPVYTIERHLVETIRTHLPVSEAEARARALSLLQVDALSRDFDLSAPWLARVLARQPRKVLHAVSEVSFAVRRGTTFGLVGESGSGKSTVARMVAGLTPPSAGQVRYDGIERWHARRANPALRQRFQMIFQDPYASLNPRWRVDRLIAEPVQVLGLARRADEIEAIVSDALRRVRMSPDDARKYPHQFSGGQRQRIAIARALASRPEFIICDEPTSALDVSVQAQVLNLMRDLQDEFGLTYLLISHNLAVIRHMCDDIGVMQRGKLVEVGEAQAVLDAPQHQYTRDLMLAIPDIAHVH